ncbi:MULTISPECIES: hypothetical protein [unclassified Clostridium]|uniref:hypothetical protein n=1 Tax=unclassified Clostridium TaxID=2614128 RepID=UPI000297237E|nr:MULTISPECIES: hypothetical protein [unclassified Clostridium]EKQ56082.1 MAG: hypothetical protein A370_02304 [Clostridium sp. Maddingley MBC34-26]
MEIKLKSKWLEDCLCKILDKKDNILKEEYLKKIKYIRIGTSNDYELQLSLQAPPKKFIPSDCGDEYECCCIYNVTKFNSIDEFLEINKWSDSYSLELKEEVVEEQSNIFDRESENISMESSKFEESLESFAPYEEEYEDDAENESLLNTDDFKYFTELEGLRFMDCCIEIHKIDFLKVLNKLRILELGTVSLESIDGVEELKNLEELCIWRN